MIYDVETPSSVELTLGAQSRLQRVICIVLEGPLTDKVLLERSHSCGGSTIVALWPRLAGSLIHPSGGCSGMQLRDRGAMNMGSERVASVFWVAGGDCS